MEGSHGWQVGPIDRVPEGDKEKKQQCALYSRTRKTPQDKK